VESIFQAGSDLVLDVLSKESQGLNQEDRMLVAVLAADLLAKGVGLDSPARLELSGSRRRACANAGFLDEEQAKQAFRSTSKQLLAGLGDGAASLSEFQASLASLDAKLQQALRPCLPALLHVQSVRLFGPDPQAEALAYYLWQRALDSLAARRGRP
jgi:thiopeptide-type bacteriocin biosynthesis protein